VKEEQHKLLSYMFITAFFTARNILPNCPKKFSQVGRVRFFFEAKKRNLTKVYLIGKCRVTLSQSQVGRVRFFFEAKKRNPTKVYLIGKCRVTLSH